MALKAALSSSLIRRQKFVNFAYVAVKQLKNEEYHKESRSRFGRKKPLTCSGVLFGSVIIGAKLEEDLKESKKQSL